MMPVKSIMMVWVLFAASCVVAAADIGFEDHPGSHFSPLEMRWTFGAHEPLTMYRRTGRRTTGGIEGSARWVKPWLDWFDTKSPELMKELGLNWCHARFYKGMGWKTEKEDLPNVKRFVDACHRNGVKVLAYMQYSTLYYETMKEEIPDLENWACIDENGKRRIYWSEAYYRWRTCPTCREWEEYVKPIMVIAITEGGYDGVMFDNAFSEPCYCERCQQAFREHLAKVPNLKDRFGFTNMKHMRLPSEKSLKAEVKDPLVQEWLLWRAEVFQTLFTRLRAHLKSVRPDAVFSANPQPFRRREAWREFSLDMTRFATLFDLVVAQNGNYPSFDAKTRCSRNRIRDLKIFEELGKTAVALCDSDSMMTEEQERFYLLPLVEDIVLGGIPTDRTIVSPVREPGYVSKSRIERRLPLLRRFNDFVRENRAVFAATSWRPVRLLYTPTAALFSDACDNGLVAAEEIMIRRHIPFGYLMSTAERLEIPSDCEVVVVPNQTCLSEKQVAALVAWAREGGKLVVTGDSGACDELNRQYFENPLRAQLPKTANVVWRERVDELVAPAKLAWVYSVPAPKDNGDAMVGDLAKVGWKAPYELQNVPEWVFAETKRTSSGYALHLVNYNPSRQMVSVSVVAPGYRVTREAPFDDSAVAPALYVLFNLKK